MSAASVHRPASRFVFSPASTGKRDTTMRDRKPGIIWRAALLAITAGTIVAYADPAPRIAHATATDEVALDRAAQQVAGLTARATRPLSTSIAKRSEAQPSELQSLIRTSYAVFCLKKKQT